MSTFVHLIADYGAADPAFAEVVHRLRAADPDLDVHTTEVPPLSTIATGFWIEQLGIHNPAFDDLLIYSNTAPRTTDTTPDRPDEGGALCYLELETGVPVVAVDAGYNLSFVRDHVTEFRTVETPASTGQFRSRDTFPQRVVELADGNRSSLGATRSVEDVPPPPERTVCHVDGYGNVKTSIRSSAFEPASDSVTVSIGETTRDATVSESVGDAPEGALALVPGSTGGADPYVEVFLRGGSAADAFDHPVPGDAITIRERT